MNQVPLVYCIVLNFNGKQLLAEALDSIRCMTYPNFKVVVVDNGSTDGSQELVRLQYPDVLLLENGKNLGFGGGNNAGIRYAIAKGAEWILLLNNDIVVDKEMLTEMMHVAQSDPTIAALSPKIYYFTEPQKIWYAGGNVNFWTGVVSHRGIREIDHGQYDRVEEFHYLTGCAFLASGKVLKSVELDHGDYFDPKYHPAYLEDVDLSTRIERTGKRLVYVPRSKLWHKVSSSSGGGMTPFKTSLKVKHSFIYFRRYAQWYHWLIIPWCILGLTLIFVLKEIAKGNFRIIGALFRGFGSITKRSTA